METGVRHYLIITGGYWAFTITDGAIRMLVVLHFHQLGYSPFAVAMLFLFYEFFGIVTNLIGGWLGSRIGLNKTMHIGMGMQIVALTMLMVPVTWLTVSYVMFAQALSGIAKDLNKMSAKASVKTLVPDENPETKLFHWVAVLTGSKNTLKGAGFFVGALLLQFVGFRATLGVLSGTLLAVLIFTLFTLPNSLGKSKQKPKFRQIFSKSSAINILSAARFFLFGARDVWFVVALPVYLYSVLHWDFMYVGGFLALWFVGYGIVQAYAPRLLRSTHQASGPDGATVTFWAFCLTLIPALIAAALYFGLHPEITLAAGLMLFGVIFAINSAVHSYLIVAWSDKDKVSLNVGFYYMANAAGRLAGTVLSGLLFQSFGLIGCLIASSGLVLAAGLVSTKLPALKNEPAGPN